MKYNFDAIGKRIQSERKKRHWAQKELIKRLNPICPIGRNSLSSLENGNATGISIELIAALCEVFGCDAGYLLCEYDEKFHVAAGVKDVTGLDSDIIDVIVSMKESAKPIMGLLNELLKDDNFLSMLQWLRRTDAHYQAEKNLDKKEKELVEFYNNAKSIEQKAEIEKKWEKCRSEEKLHHAEVQGGRFALITALMRLLDERFGSLPPTGHIDISSEKPHRNLF